MDEIKELSIKGLKWFYKTIRKKLVIITIINKLTIKINPLFHI